MKTLLNRIRWKINEIRRVKLPLFASPGPAWEDEAVRLLEDRFVRTKCNRERRLREKFDYIEQYCREIKKFKGRVLDLGPGPGEFLELCRHYGHSVLGIDAGFKDYGGMGMNYLEYSKLMTDRQKIPVFYTGLDNLLEQGALPFRDGSFDFINSQGSITCIFNRFIRTNAFKAELTLSEQVESFSWEENSQLRDILRHFILEMYRLLSSGRHLLIFESRTIGDQNAAKYDAIMSKTAMECGFKLEMTRFGTLHKFIKV